MKLTSHSGREMAVIDAESQSEEEFPTWAKNALGAWIVAHAVDLTFMGLDPDSCEVSYKGSEYVGTVSLHTPKGIIPLRVSRPENPSG